MRSKTALAWGIMESETLNMTMLFDFFGDLLTIKQREYFDLYHNEDLSLSEIAEKNGISRQGAYDIIARAEKTLLEIEQKTGVIKKWRETRAELEEAKNLAKKIMQLSNNECAELTNELLRTLSALTLS